MVKIHLVLVVSGEQEGNQMPKVSMKIYLKTLHPSSIWMVKADQLKIKKELTLLLI